MKKLLIALVFFTAIQNAFGQNVGIGTTSPETKLHVNGKTTLSDSVFVGSGIIINANQQITNNNFLEFGKGITKDINAGKIGYQILSTGLDIVGAGTTDIIRKIKLWGEAGIELSGKTLVVSNDGLQVKGNFGMGASYDIGAGTNMLWYPKKGAFRAGGVSGYGWDDSNIGAYSTALGHESVAKGDYSFVTGNGSQAWGKNAIAIGKDAFAYADNSIALGNNIFILSEAKGSCIITDASRANGNTATLTPNQMTMRFDGGYQLYSDSISTPSKGLFFMNGNVGLGTTMPQSKLEVKGRITTDDLKIINGASNGKVLTSDASGNATWQNIASLTNYWTLSGNQIYNNNTSSVGVGTTSPTGSLDVSSSSNEPLYVRGQNSQIRIIENDNANKQWKLEAQAGNFSVTEDGVAVPFVIKAGSDANVLVTTNDTVQVKKLQVGTNGTTIAKMQAGTFAIGSQPLAQATKEVTFSFTNPFTNTPKIIATCRNEVSTYTDQYAATVKTVSATSVTFIIRRLDSGAGWGQNVQLDWWGFE